MGFSGSHDKTVALVESGRYQAGVVNYKVYDRRVAEGTTDPEVVKVIWRTPFYADYNFTAHPDLETVFGAGFTDRLQQALIGITDAELLSALPREALIPAHNDEFEGIAAVARELGMSRLQLRKKNHISRKMISIDSGAEIAIWMNISTPKLSSATGRPVM